MNSQNINNASCEDVSLLNWIGKSHLQAGRYSFNDMKYGKLTIIGKEFRMFPKQTSTQPRTYVKVKCDCGKKLDVQVYKIKSGHTSTCGCIRLENPSQRTHGLSGTELHIKWVHIKTRCYCSKNSKNHKRYSGRGITICEEWRNDFMAFYNWAINNGWKKGLTIDRINNDGNYEPSNCRFVTNKINCRNSSCAKLNQQSADEIRWMYVNTNKLMKDLSKEYGVSACQIGRVIRNECWA